MVTQRVRRSFTVDTLLALIRQGVMFTDPKYGLAEFPGELPAIAGTEVASRGLAPGTRYTSRQGIRVETRGANAIFPQSHRATSSGSEGIGREDRIEDDECFGFATEDPVHEPAVPRVFGAGEVGDLLVHDLDRAVQ